MKELPATLILRPFDFETLATHIYTYASLGQMEDAALPALIILAIGMVPVMFGIGVLEKRAPPLSGLVKQFAADQHAADFRCSGTDFRQLGIAQITPDRIIIYITIAAHQLNRIQRALGGIFSGE